jgi:hypothetical protein
MPGAIAKIVRSRRFQPLARSPKAPESNRERLRLETHATQTKQTPPNHPNRENIAVFQGRLRQAQPPKAAERQSNSNRKPKLLETP